MNKEELQEKALQYALGTLPATELSEMESQVLSDRELQTAVHEWQRVNEADALECEQLEPSFQIYSNVMSHLDTSRAKAVTGSDSKKTPIVNFLSWGGWVAAVCIAVLFAFTVNPEDRSEISQVARLADGSESDIVLSDLGNPEQKATFAGNQDQDEFQDRLLELTGLAEAYWFSREGLPPESEGGVDTEAFAGGFSIYDRKIKIGVIGIENIPESRLGKFYNVWAKASPDSKPVWAGTLKQGEAGSRLAFFDLSSNDAIKDMDETISFFVTEESEQKPPQPEGRIVLSGI